MVFEGKGDGGREDRSWRPERKLCTTGEGRVGVEARDNESEMQMNEDVQPRVKSTELRESVARWGLRSMRGVCHFSLSRG